MGLVRVVLASACVSLCPKARVWRGTGVPQVQVDMLASMVWYAVSYIYIYAYVRFSTEKNKAEVSYIYSCVGITVFGAV